MKITKGTVVAIDYVLKDDDEKLLDQSQSNQPLIYLHGYKNIIPGLESALLGKTEGEDFEIRVAPVDGYGETNPELEQIVPRNRLQGVESLEVGMEFQANTDQGPVSVRVLKIDDDDVTVDGNHPLAGMHLNFHITVRSIREATKEEITNGHIYQSGGCCGGGSDGSCCGDEH